LSQKERLSRGLNDRTGLSGRLIREIRPAT
jgi:hypothetical protein